jgi:hypothetical protein
MGEYLGEMQVVADGLLEGAEAEVAEREPERESAEGAGEFHGFFEKGEALYRIGCKRAGVVAGVGEGAARIGGIGVEETAAAGGLIEPLVGIEGDGVSEVDSVEGFGNGERGECAVGSVDVEPEVVFAADRSNFAEWVDAAGGGGSGTRNDGNGLEAGVDVALYGLAQIVRAHTEGAVDGDEADGIVTKAEECGGLGSGHVRFSGAIGDSAVDAGLVGRRFGFACHAEAHEVRR